MALFTDGPPSTVDDLAAQDSQLLNVANVEGIDVTQKLTLAHDEIGLDLISLLMGTERRDQWLWMNTTPSLSSVVATAPLKLWHTYRTLEMVYSDAYNNELNDRYAGKRDQFHKMATWAYEKLVQIGIGMAAVPVPKASAPQMLAAQPASGQNLPDGTYFAAIAWVNQAGEEGRVSTPGAVTTVSSTYLVNAGNPPGTAAGWNVFAGTDPNKLALQNASPVPVGEVWVQPGVPSTTGRGPGTGQAGNYVREIPRVIQRG
jgi:hypothetical protein